MQYGSIALPVDRRHRPIEVSAFRWSSADTGWAGFPIESRVFASPGHLRNYGLDHALLALCVAGVGQLQIGDGEAVRQATSLPGRFSLLCQGFGQEPVEWSGRREVLFVGFRAEQLERLMGGGPGLACLDVEPQYAISDPRVVSLVVRMRDEIQAACPTGTLYAEALSIALFERLRRRYARDAPLKGRCGSALSPTLVRRVRDYIRANLASDLGLVKIANQLDLSPHHFSMLFKRAVGVPPHHYVLRERIQEAQRLLAVGQMSISELALNLGFSDQSHFSRVFRKMTGTTPKRYQTTT